VTVLVVALDQSERRLEVLHNSKKQSFRTERENLPMPQEQVGLEVAFVHQMIWEMK
jgi:hypothetical protein